MKASIEILYHLRCNYCQKWWSYGDISVMMGQTVTCPHCGKSDEIESIVNGKDEEVLGTRWWYSLPDDQR